MPKIIMALDRASSVRSTDRNGFLHIKRSHVSKACVSPYYGREIPDWERLGLDPDKVYMGYRDPVELEKSLPTWQGLPLQMDHHVDSADDPQKEARVGAVNSIVWNSPYVDASLTVWDMIAIDAIKDGSCRELSCCYWYDADFTPGEIDGERYDFTMRNIEGNHIALVAEGRAGHDVLVADAKPVEIEEKVMWQKKFKGAKDDQSVEQTEVDLAQAIIDLHRVNPMTGEVMDIAEDEESVGKLREIVDKIGEEDAKALYDLFTAMADTKVAGDETPEETKAFAEGVEYGEEIEKNEPKKLDSEHESEGMKKAEDESEEKAEDACGKDDDLTAGLIGKIVTVLPELTPEQVEKLKVALEADYPYVATEEVTEELAVAADKALKKLAIDAKQIRAEATAQAVAQMRAVSEACRKVRPLVGEMDPLAFDSAVSVYGHALGQMGVDAKKYAADAYAGMVDMLLREQSAIKMPSMDSASVPCDGPFKNLNNISLGE